MVDSVMNGKNESNSKFMGQLADRVWDVRSAGEMIVKEGRRRTGECLSKANGRARASKCKLIPSVGQSGLNSSDNTYLPLLE